MKKGVKLTGRESGEITRRSFFQKGLETASMGFLIAATTSGFELDAIGQSAGGGALRPTPPQGEGPFYTFNSTNNAPELSVANRDADLTRLMGNPDGAEGDLLYLHGQLVNTQAQALSGALIEIWQTDHDGHYYHSGDSPERVDRNFQSYGAVQTSGQGAFKFLTVRPGKYPGRAIHIHLKVQIGNLLRLTTQLYFGDDPTLAGDGLAASAGGDLPLLTLTPKPTFDDENRPTLVAHCNLVVDQSSEESATIPVELSRLRRRDDKVFMTLPPGPVVDIQFLNDLESDEWKTIATDVSLFFCDDDSDRMAKGTGFYRALTKAIGQ
jgi:protocatechuate 3,4-dioxygenase beta subunit